MMTETSCPARPEEVFERIGSELGVSLAQMTQDENFRIGSEARRVVATPGSVPEMVELLRLAFSESWRVIPAGAGTWLAMGNPPAGFELIVSTSKLNRLLEYEPADLTATVEAGLTLAEFNSIASRHGQWIPLDPFGSPDSTLGAIISTGSYGPLRCGYGTPRDWLIGLQVAHIDGRLSRAGGKVVKNVAGYDLCKLYTGSYGTLAVVTEMTFKLRSTGPTDRTIIFSAPNVDELVKLAGLLRQSSLQPAALEILTPREINLPTVDPSSAILILRLIHEPEAVDSQLAEASRVGAMFRPAVLAAAEASALWSACHQSETGSELSTSLVLSFLPADLGEVFNLIAQQIPGVEARAHAASGVIRVHIRVNDAVSVGQLRRLREALTARGGHMVLTLADEQLRREVDTWGEVGETGLLMASIKKMYDPNCLLSPGRFVNGI